MASNGSKVRDPEISRLIREAGRACDDSRAMLRVSHEARHRLGVVFAEVEVRIRESRALLARFGD